MFLAMGSKLVLVAILFSSCVSVGFSQMLGGSGLGLACIQKLAPCMSFMHLSSTPPPPACCNPLKEMIANDKECLCNVFNNDNLLQRFNVSKDEALNMPKACGAEADVSLCNTQENATSTTSPPPSEAKSAMPPTTKSTSTTASPPSEGGLVSSTNNTEKSLAHGLSPFSRSGVILAPMVAFMSIII